MSAKVGGRWPPSLADVDQVWLKFYLVRGGFDLMRGDVDQVWGEAMREWGWRWQLLMLILAHADHGTTRCRAMVLWEGRGRLCRRVRAASCERFLVAPRSGWQANEK